ncbi:hypothetical protein ACWGRK_02060 [Saccharomonospora azurea]|uniref:Uncharacterized protein n=1 Tax=Saccharomonospora azurea NA-128 TaxID=882081 RepID=H8GCK4_9PSEU|nr:hypothetical protein [Saccharomonospora azurea]EHK84216.1 hypothetical protein SZMC14600_18219 [Saccharomonospora azurea SZMC 14600]EHY89812.1 hypothetical protein SacazDRAFT_02925 [Saccharomonospora azurea NA-128]
MAEQKPALVLHLVSGGEPLLFTLHPDEVDELRSRLHLHLEHGSVQTVRTAEDRTVAVNFAHVAAAYLDDLHRQGKVFGLH